MSNGFYQEERAIYNHYLASFQNLKKLAIRFTIHFHPFHLQQLREGSKQFPLSNIHHSKFSNKTKPFWGVSIDAKTTDTLVFKRC